MGTGADSARTVVEFSGPGFCQRDEFGQRFDRKIRIYNQQRGRGCHHRYAPEFPQGIIEQLVLEKAGIDHERRIRCKQCITVGRRTADGAGADHCRSTGPIVDDDARVQDAAGLGRYNSKGDIGTAAGGVGYDDADRMRGIVLCRCGVRRHHDRGDTDELRQKRLEIHEGFPALDGYDGLTDGCPCNQPAFPSRASARREAHPIVASRTASAHARSYSSRLIHSSMVCGSFWPAPKVTVGTPWRTIQFASSPPFAARIAGVPPTLDTAATARLTTGRLSFMRNG